MDRHRSGLTLDLDPLAGQLVQATTVDTDRGRHWRSLFDFAPTQMLGDGLTEPAPASTVTAVMS